MELILNMIWLVTSLSVLAVWGGWSLFHRPSGRCTRQQYLFEALLLICTALLLFPIISMSDDIAGDLNAEDKTSAYQVTGHHAHDGTASPIYLPLWVFTLCMTTLGIATLTSTPHWSQKYKRFREILFSETRPFRAPPCLI